MRLRALAALIATAIVACGLDREGFRDGAALDATSSAGGTTTTGDSSSTEGSGASGAPTGGAGGAPTGGSGGESNASGGAGGSPLECWGPDTICCAGTPCPTATMECCLENQYSGEDATCVAKGACPDLTVSCDDSEDCPGSEICCISWDGSNYQGVACEDVCIPPVPASVPGKYPMCNLVDGTCPATLHCEYDAYVGEVGWGFCYY